MRGLWSVIIFIWVTVGGVELGSALHLSHPHVTVHHLPAAVMSTRLSLSVWDGTSKNKCYLSLSTHDMWERNRNTVLSEAEPSLVDMFSYRKVEKYQEKGQVKGKPCCGCASKLILMTHISSTWPLPKGDKIHTLWLKQLEQKI